MTDPVHVVCPHCDTVNRVMRERLGAGSKCGNCKAPLFRGEPIELDASNFDRHVEKSDLPVAMDFWTAWCGPCKMMAPHFARAARDLEPIARLAKLDTEAAPQIAGRYNIRGIPTVIVFRKGQEIARQSGAMDHAGLTRWLRSALP